MVFSGPIALFHIPRVALHIPSIGLDIPSVAARVAPVGFGRRRRVGLGLGQVALWLLDRILEVRVIRSLDGIADKLSITGQNNS